MSVCIAALAENKKKMVLAADQMIISSIPIPYQYETADVKKMYQLTDDSTVLIAGNALFGYEIIDHALKKINDEQPDSFDKIAEILRSEYQNYRRRLIEEHILEPRGLDLNTYYENQLKLNMAVVQEIETSLVNESIGVDMIIGGYDGKHCHVYSITHPGVLLSHDAIGFVCVGIGAPHATYHLIGSHYDTSLDVGEVEKLVLGAKQKSEVAPGVGKETTLTYLPKKSGFKL